MTVTPEVMQAAQGFVLLTLAAFLLARYVPNHATRIRAGLLVMYVIGAIGLVLYSLG
ncbi:MAG: hypothetical protein AB7F35_23290 [Acetobacteraceae bacterium]